MRVHLPTTTLLVALVVSLACGPGTPELEAIPHPDLAPIEAAARTQIEAARSTLETLGPEAPRADRARAMGEIGRLYQVYGFDTAARAAYANAVALAPDSFRWLYHLGSLELDGGEADAGRRHLEAALEIRPGDAPTLLRLARAALDRSDLVSAGELYRSAAENAPDCAAASFGVGLVALESDRPGEAIAAFQRALEIDPAASQVHRPLAMAHRAAGDLDAAREHLARSGTAAPRCPDPLLAELTELATGASALFERAAQARIEGHLDAASDLARQAIEADSDHTPALRLLGSLLIDQGRAAEAIETLDRAAALAPEDRRTYVLLGRAYRLAGSLAASIEALERAIELDPRDVRAHAELARTLLESGDWRTARRRLESALELDPDDTDLAVQHARALAATGEARAARSELELIVERRAESSLARVALAALALDSGDVDTAEEHLSRALSGDGSPDTLALAHFHLARIRLERGDVNLARRHLETAVELAPGFVEARLARADLELEAGNFSDAGRRFAAIAEQRPDLVAARTGQALALLESGRHLEARRLLDVAWGELPEALAVGHLLARVLATAPAPRVRNTARAVELAAELFERQPSLVHGETVAMALAAADRFEEAIVWQRRLLDEAHSGGAPADVVLRLETRLGDYERGLAPRAQWQ